MIIDLCQEQKGQGFAADPVYGRAKCLPMLGEISGDSMGMADPETSW